jgi:pyruvate,water dikinase
VTPLAGAHDVARFGGKAASLARLQATGFAVPSGVVLDVEAVRALTDGADTQALIATAKEHGPLVAVRSSAVDEDGLSHSFAGVHLSRVGVTPHEVQAAVVEVSESATSEHALAYRRMKGLKATPGIAVIVQRAISSRVSGVLFTRHPTTGAREIVIDGTWGLGESVVQGLVTPDHVRLTIDGKVIEQSIGEKDRMWLLDTGGAREHAVPDDDMHRCCILAPLRSELVALAEQAERAFGPALDLEWAHDGERLWVLQCRPITA